MNMNDIRFQIDENSKAIKKSMEKNGFILNTEVHKLLDERELIRQNCTHEFIKGKCKWCDLEEEQIID